MTARRIGLTGGIGSGKSTVAALWVARGAMLVDTDAIARTLTAVGGAALPALRREFGEQIINKDGALDRDRMREMAFADSLNRRRLEKHLHPLIGEIAQEQARLAIGPVVLFDVPLLAESSLWRGRCDRILVVDCLESTQVARVTQRAGWSPEQVRRVVAQQASRETRRAIGDAVIYNDECSLADLAESVGALWRLWTAPP
jgi:dephospho-CoA kinase